MGHLVRETLPALTDLAKNVGTIPRVFQYIMGQRNFSALMVQFTLTTSKQKLPPIILLVPMYQVSLLL